MFDIQMLHVYIGIRSSWKNKFKSSQQFLNKETLAFCFENSFFKLQLFVVRICNYLHAVR